MTSLSYGPYSETRSYNSLLQLTEITTTSGGTAAMDMQYDYVPGQNNGRISQTIDRVRNETVTYSYDALNRLIGAAVAGTWSEAYSYDGYGNLTRKDPSNAPNLQTTYDWATNHENGVSYDANGNVTPGGYYPNTWDVENRLAMQGTTNGGGTMWVYDPWGKRVEKNVNRGCNGTGRSEGRSSFTFTG